MEVGAVSTWVGIIASIAGIVLSIVAIVFAILVDHRSRQISDQTIRSLQKIESAVERLSADTQELIKAAWDKMLRVVEPQSTTAIDFDAKTLASGLASELRAELAPLRSGIQAGSASDKAQKFEETLKELEKSIESVLKVQRNPSRPSEAIDKLIEKIPTLSDATQAVLAVIHDCGVHLTREQYRAALDTPQLGNAIRDLRGEGLLVPVVHSFSDGRKEPCYFFPRGLFGALTASLKLLPAPERGVQEMAQAWLQTVGYPSEQKARMRPTSASEN